MDTSNREKRFTCVGMLASLLLVGVMGAGSAGARAQESHLKSERFKPQPSQPNGEVTTPGIVVSPNEDHRMCPGDVIEIQVNMAPELSNTSRINADGTFMMPYVGRINARNKTIDQLAEEIAGRLRGDYLKNPMVKVSVKQIYSHSYFIQGAIRRSGVYQIEGRPTLLELLTVGGGLGDNYGTTAFIIRRIKPKAAPEQAEASVKTVTGQTAANDKPAAAAPDVSETPDETPDVAGAKNKDPDRNRDQNQSVTQPAQGQASFEMLKANITGLLKGSFDQNLILEPGDIVNIPPSDVFFVAGEVRMPGSFPLKDGTTLRQAISMAQGTTAKASPGRGVIYRENEKGQRQEIKVDIEAVMRGRTDDIPLLANDIVIVPNSSVKSVAIPVLSAFGTGVAWAVGGALPGRQ